MRILNSPIVNFDLNYSIDTSARLIGRAVSKHAPFYRVINRVSSSDAGPVGPLSLLKMTMTYTFVVGQSRRDPAKSGIALNRLDRVVIILDNVITLF